MVSERYSYWRETQTIFPRPPTEELVTAPATATATATLTTASN